MRSPKGRADTVMAAFELCGELGISKTDVFKYAGISPEECRWAFAPPEVQRNCYVEFEHWELLVNSSSVLSGGGDQAAQQASILMPSLDGLGDLGHMVATSPTVGAALDLLVTVFTILASGVPVWSVQTKGHVCTMVCDEAYTTRPSPGANFSIKTILMHMVVNLLQGLCSGGLPILSVALRQEKNKADRGMVCPLGQNDMKLVYSHHRNEVQLPREVLAEPTRYANQAMHARFRELALGATGSSEFVTMRTRLEHVLQNSPGDLPDTIGQVATRLGMSSRALQRALARETTDFSHELDRYRARLAEQEVLWGEMSFSELAYRLGFGSPAAFSRAYRRWFGKSPREARNGAVGASV